ncbi:MAG: helicase-exonuclease AddAB subunit AddA [Clostridia bacterium]|nr:helicase-exonuclease AddAB subunit AddA [Clostridia bacterium]
MSKEVSWTQEQEQAIYEKGSNILVAAAAGSGKTAVLVERIINKIIKENIDIDKLLVVTFTNAAAAEMRERVLKAIYKKIDENIEDNRLQKQITLLNKASICTIDSFCLDIVRNNFFEIDMPQNFRIADTTEIEIIKQEVIEDLFEEKYEAEDKDFAKLINTYTGYQDDTPLKELILKIYTYIQSTPFPEKWLKEKIEMFNLKNKLEEDFSKTIWGKLLLKQVEEILQDGIIKLENEKKNIEKYDELQKYNLILSDDIEQLEMLKSNLDTWDKAYTIYTNIKFKTWSADKKITIEAKDKAKEVRDKVKESLKAIDKILIFDSGEANEDINNMYEILEKLGQVIIEYGDKFSKKKREKNIVDFNDVEHFALKILINEEGKPTEIAKRYQEKFEEIAIDEYQDSNLVQEYILNSISRGNNVFMVGDVKQSIYKFRQARPELFLNKYKTYKLKKEKAILEDLKIQLFKNFRSRKEVLDFSNIIFDNIMTEKLGELNYTEEEYLNLGASYEDTEQDLRTEINIINVKEEIEEETEDNEYDNEIQEIEEVEEKERIEDIELEAKFVANRIKQLIDSKFQVYDAKSKEKRDIKYKDIVILLRSTKALVPIFEKEILRLKMPVFSDTSSEYLESIEIQTIMSLLKIIDNPLQEISLISVMRSAIGGFTDNELVKIRLSDKYDNFYNTVLKSRKDVDSKLRNKIDRFLNNIETWRREQEYLSLDELIWKIYNDTGFYNYVGLMNNGTLRQANLKMLFERAKQCESISFKGLFNFINYIEKIKASSKDMDSAKIIGENDNVIRIMSIHKSKGLEFPIVFLSGTGKQFNMQDLNKKVLLHADIGIGVKYIDYDKLIEYDTLSKQAIKQQMHVETLSEEMRILYVALTRAKEKIIITGKSTVEKQKEIEELPKKYENVNNILLKKYKTYIDWIMLVEAFNKDKMKNLVDIKMYQRDEVIQTCDTNSNEKENLLDEILNKISKVEKDRIQQKKVAQMLEYEYPNKLATIIPTKTSVTEIKKQKNTDNESDKVKKEITLNIPKFLQEDEDLKITNAEKGTLIHLCMQKLELKEYTYNEIKELIEKLEAKKIITKKEAESININKVYQFTKSQIWKEMKQAKEVEREKPFYINISAQEIYGEELNEKVLVQGVIDLYYIDKEDNLILVDYKTDYVENRDEQNLINKYRTQLELYKRALEGALSKKVSKMYIYSTYLEKEILL